MTAHVARIVLAAQLAASAAHADPAEDSALDHLDRGVAAYRAGELGRAHDELAMASQLAPDRPNPYRWLALTEAALGDCASALAHIEGFLSRVPPEDPRVAELVALRERCVHTGLLTVTSTPPSAAIRIDGGSPIATTPAHRLALPTGHHRLVLEKPGYAPLSHDFELTGSGELLSSFTLTASPADRPLVRRWWFWAAVGAVAITAAGVGYELTRGSASRLPPVTCDPAGCHP